MPLPSLRPSRLCGAVSRRTPPALRHPDGNRNLAAPHGRLPRTEPSLISRQRPPVGKIAARLPQGRFPYPPGPGRPERLLCPNRSRCRPSEKLGCGRPESVRQHQIRHFPVARTAGESRRVQTQNRRQADGGMRQHPLLPRPRRSRTAAAGLAVLPRRCPAGDCAASSRTLRSRFSDGLNAGFPHAETQRRPSGGRRYAGLDRRQHGRALCLLRRRRCRLCRRQPGG